MGTQGCGASKEEEEVEKLAGEADMMLKVVKEDEEYIAKCLQYETLWRKEALTEIEKEI
jgi:hypothetical protein